MFVNICLILTDFVCCLVQQSIGYLLWIEYHYFTTKFLS